ncbi:MAG TPA: shikimate dehydrogenase, partial [Dongiaceae bacterium]|nr:shikimate dehydrogenase [Dongiaceae bacterium]
ARLKGRFGTERAESVQDIAPAAATADGIVNATPVGMAKLPGMPIRPDLISARHWVADIVYFPLETELLRHARRLGCRTLSGEGMAVFQAVRAFELFTGIKPDLDRMRAAFAAFDRTPAG